MENLLSRIGNTPLVTLQESPVRVVAKVEWCSPGASVKDRAAVYMLLDALERGVAGPGSTVIEPTSGNTGVGLAWASAALGMKLILVMPDSTEPRKQALPALYGARVELTPGRAGMAGAVARAEALGREIPGSYLPRQFENPANVRAHLETTGPELWRQAGRVDAFVAGIGSGGTFTGVGRYLREKNPRVFLGAVEPWTSPLLRLGHAGSHGISGIGANFVPALLDRSLVDRVLPVTDQAARKMAARAARQWGIAPGLSGGANLAAAFALAGEDRFRGGTIATVLPDSMERYLEI